MGTRSGDREAVSFGGTVPPGALGLQPGFSGLKSFIIINHKDQFYYVIKQVG
jgi:hypothetical protein